MKKLKKEIKPIPNFKNTQEESDFWQNHDSTNYIDWSKAKTASFPNLKLSTETISLRLPETLLNEIKILANKQDVPYQSFIKMLLTQKVKHLYKGRYKVKIKGQSSSAA
jgi:predicted DNA binding CopG/RHH family protein